MLMRYWIAVISEKTTLVLNMEELVNILCYFVKYYCIVGKFSEDNIWQKLLKLTKGYTYIHNTDYGDIILCAYKVILLSCTLVSLVYE